MAKLKEEAQAEAEDAVEKAVREARSMKNEAEGTIEHYRNQAERFKDDFYTEVRDRPLRTLGIAAMIGFAIGAIWKT